MKFTFIIFAIVLGVFIISQLYLILSSTETQVYRVIKTEKDFEIRFYPSATMATISMYAKNYKELSSKGFRKLASFIFGSNQTKENIAMTSPVHMNINDSLSYMSFVMPAKYTRENLPQPKDSTVRIVNTPDEYVAAIRFGGFASNEEILKYAEKLEYALKENDIDFYGNFRFLGYDAPFQFLGRKNEIIVSVHWEKNNK